jgi:2-polyprenyl-3-methyl-5-hydroxy-6-metoxy-1,4-benzoquinol methylase
MLDAERRAQETLGGSTPAVHALVLHALEETRAPVGTLLDVGCGAGELRATLSGKYTRYVGIDIVRHAGFPDGAELVLMNLDSGSVPLPDGYADAVVCAETIEHVENPRLLVRELVRLLRPGGFLFVTTPNQLSLASLLCLAARGEFQYFQESPGQYPAHITALLPIDLARMATECGLDQVELCYSARGRVPFSPLRWPSALAARTGRRGQLFSDNVLVRGRRPPA